MKIGTFFWRVRYICYPSFVIPARLSHVLWWKLHIFYLTIGLVISRPLSQLLWWEIYKISHSRKTYLFLWRSKKLQRERMTINVITISRHIFTWVCGHASGPVSRGPYSETFCVRVIIFGHTNFTVNIVDPERARRACRGPPMLTLTPAHLCYPLTIEQLSVSVSH